MHGRSKVRLRVSVKVCWHICSSEEILAVDHGGQAHKGVWGMSWRQKAMKGVEGCDKPGEAVKRALIPGFPNDRILNT